MKKKLTHESKWGWYAVKNLFESTITGEPTQSKIDSNYSNDYKIYEENIIVVKAQSFEQAYKLGEKKAKEAEMDYYNPYDQQVKCRYVDSIDCFHLFDDIIKSGTEVYSRHLRTSKDNSTKDLIRDFFPEALLDGSVGKDHNYPFRIREFNKI